jgi:hypothetical protein
VNGRRITVPAGGSGTFPAGATHRWWDDGDEPLVCQGFTHPAGDLDRHLQAVFDVIISGPPDRPPIFYVAQVS